MKKKKQKYVYKKKLFISESDMLIFYLFYNKKRYLFYRK